MSLIQFAFDYVFHLSDRAARLYDRRLSRFFSQKNNRIYILPNTDGLIYVILLSFVLLMAIVEHVHLTYFVLAVASGLFFVGLVFCNYNLSKIHVHALQCSSAHVGEQARVMLKVENRAKRLRRSLTLELPLGEKTRKFSGQTLLHLKPDEPALVTIAVPLFVRGRYEVPRIRLSTVFPFGLFRSWTWQQINAVYFAYPAPKGNLPLPMDGVPNQQNVSRNDRGEEGFGADFSGHKVYEFGDSLRHVNWRLVARGFDPHVKKFTGGNFRMVHIDLEQLGTIADPEQRLCQVSKWIGICCRNRISFQLRLSCNESDYYTPHDRDVHTALERLAVWKNEAL